MRERRLFERMVHAHFDICAKCEILSDALRHLGRMAPPSATDIRIWAGVLSGGKEPLE